MKKLIFFIAALAVFFPLYTVRAADGGTPALPGANGKAYLYIGADYTLINGERLSLSAPAFLSETAAMAPLAVLCSNLLNCTVSWDRETGTITINDAGQITLIKGDRAVRNGIEYSFAPAAVNGVFFVPVRFFNELFGCTVNYNARAKSVEIVAPLKTLPLTADFTIEEQFFSGATPAYTITGSGSGNITQYVWLINGPGGTRQGYDLPALIGKKPAPGIYRLQLKIKNSAQLWSAFCPAKTFEVLPNAAPKINSFSPSKSVYAPGETTRFDILVQNEEGESLTYSWRYTWEKDGVRHTAAGRPRAFFISGSVELSLFVTDDAGQISNTATCKLSVSGDPIASEARYKFGDLVPGERYFNPGQINFNNLPALLPDQAEVENGLLLASNNPEKNYGPGILYQDTGEGAIRLRYHHRNVTQFMMKIGLFAENRTDKPVTLSIMQQGLAGPSADTLAVGQRAIISYFEWDGAVKTVIIAPGEKYQINAGQAAMGSDNIVAGLIDVYTDGPLVFTTAAITSNLDRPDYENLPRLKRDGTHIRGTFDQTGIDLSYIAKGEDSEKIVLGREDALPQEDNYPAYFSYGTDMMSGEAIRNNGARAVLHHISVYAEQTVGVLINPRGTIYMGAIRIDGVNQIIGVPAEGFTQGITEAVVLAVIPAGETLNLSYLPPSGSDSPLLLVLIPEDEWGDY